MAAERVETRVSLDWSAPKHWAPGRQRPCRCCGKPTIGRDNLLNPCHLECAQAELAAELAGMYGATGGA